MLFGKELKELLTGIPVFPQKCFEYPEGYKRWDCLNPYFEKLTLAVSANVALTEALELVNKGGMSDCHTVAHTIGEANLEKHDFDMGQAFATCGFQCIQGCMHGVMESYIQKEANPYNMFGEIKDTCDSVGSASGSVKERMLWDQCHHGIGHGLLQHGFLPLEDAVSVCTSFDYEHAQRRCVGGLMMENMNQYLLLDESSLREVLPRVCAPIEKFKGDETMSYTWDYCIEDVALGLMFYTGHDVERSQELCEGLLQESHVIYCRTSVITVVQNERNLLITDIPFFVEPQESF